MHLFLINSHQCSGMARCLLRFTAPPEAADRILTISSRVRSRSSNNRHYKQCRFCFVLGLCCYCFCAETQRANDRDFENATTTDENHCIHIIIAHIQIGEQQLVNEFLHFCCTLFRDAWRDKTAGAWYFVFSK